MKQTTGYQPFRDGIETGLTTACPHCGVKPRNGHTLGELGKCDWIRKPQSEKEAILAQRAKREEAA